MTATPRTIEMDRTAGALRPSAARRAPRTPGWAWLALAPIAWLASGCYVQTQRFPGRLTPVVDPLPDGTTALFEPGPEEVLIVRHADSVTVRAAGASAGRPLEFHDKRARLSAGAWVQTGPSGMAEVIFASGARLELSGAASGAVGSESRREPLFRLREVTRASFTTEESAQLELPGGARLATDSGPFVFERVAERTLRVRNRSIGMGRIAFRDQIFELAPGEVIDLAEPPSGTAPIQRDPGFRLLPTDYAPIEIRGEVEILAAESGARLRAVGAHEIAAHGLVLRLDPGDEVLIEGIGAPRVGANPGVTGN